MPRLAPNSCNENRMTFGTAERKMLAVALTEGKKNRTQKYITAFALPLTGVALAAGLGVGGYFIGQKIADADPLTRLNNYGKKVYGQLITGEVYNSQTGEYEPFSVTSTDPEQPQREIINPAAGMTLIGSLFGLGMKIGQSSLEYLVQSPRYRYYEEANK